MKKILAITIVTIVIIIGIYTSYNKTKVTGNVEEVINYDSAQDIEITENNSKINITSGGEYNISGTSSNASITINTEEKVNLILNNVDLKNSSGPVILVENADKITITLKEETTNKLTDGESYENTEYDAVIYSKDDLDIIGEGTLIINSNFENGIKSNDDLKIYSGNIKVNAKTNGIIGKDSVTISGGNIDITCNGDAIKSNNDTDEGKGNVVINDGSITINAKEDGIQAENDLTINKGTIDITTGSGAKTLSGKTGWENQTSNEESMKSIKAGGNITISDGTFKINSSDDGIHSNSNIIINGGTFNIKSSTDGIHGDSLVEISDGTFDITASEGIEATYVKINGGNITINGADDGINVGNKSSEYTPTIEINGGIITIKMSSGDTDGIDSNGNLYINGGTIDITCNSPFDYDGEAKYTGGKMIVNGEETTEITNQMMGGMMQGGMMQGGMQNGQGEIQEYRQNQGPQGRR